jgi:hypothetical protein
LGGAAELRIRSAYVATLRAVLLATGPSAGVVAAQADLNGAAAYGAGHLDKFGSSVVRVGDLDGDGVDDLVVGAPDADGAAGAESGAVHFRSGADPTVELGVAFGTSVGERSGWALARLGDVDGDGLEDVAVGAATYNGAAGNMQGRVLILSGATFAEIVSATSNESGSEFGRALASAGDRDGDGIDELLIGAPFADALAVDGGAAFLVKVTAAGFSLLARFDGDQAGENAGLALASLGDLDGDALRELVVASPDWDGTPGINSGRVHVFSSDSNGGFPLLNTLLGAGKNEQFGWAVAPIADPGGSGVTRLLATYIGRTQAGNAFAGGGSIYDALTGAELLAAAGTNRNEFLGTSVATAGDLDRDGFEDFALGTPAFSPSGAFFGGCVDVFSSTTAYGPAAKRLFRRQGSTGQRLGEALADVGDLDGDGSPDFFAGATGEFDPANGLQTGAVHVVLGQRPLLAPDQPHYVDFAMMTLDGVGYGNLPVFFMFGVALSNQGDFGISFASPWTIVPAAPSGPFGDCTLSGQIPDFMGLPTTIYAQALLPYAAARSKNLLFSEIATLSIN